jgi:kynurenine formamidase
LSFSYIHGGAWRDPEIDSMALEPAFEILSVLRFQNSISGFASINHRLSPYPNHPTSPSSPEDPSRNAKHPDHLLDVSRALAFLETKYGISSGFILVGHSAGATLAFQIHEQCEGFDVPIPLGVLGIEGIYDLPDLVKTYEKSPAYRQFVENAFGPDEMVWKSASPAFSNKPAVWEKAQGIFIAHSDEDELLSRRQADLMVKRLQDTSKYKAKTHYLAATGQHDEIWKSGHELARLIETALSLL